MTPSRSLFVLSGLFSVCAFACSDAGGATAPGGDESDTFGGSGGVVTGAGGDYVGPPGTGGAPPGTGAVPNGTGAVPATGGTPPATGGAPPGTGGVPPATGGVINNGGVANVGGTVSSGGTPALGSCDMRTETSANPLTQACNEVTTPTGTVVPLGPYGAIMDVNVGQGFENTDPLDEATCPGFAALFNEDAALTAQLLDVGPQPCNAPGPNEGDCLDFKLYSTYRPATWPDGPIPVITWGNGTCAQPEGYGALLRYVASHGFFVVAANNREVGSGVEILHALDYAAAANDDPNSPYYGHLDLSQVGVMGHSQGGQGTAAAASDPRIDAAILFNGGSSAAKPFLIMGGELDIGGIGATLTTMQSAIAASPPAAFFYYYNPAGNPLDNLRGHLVLMLEPERVVDQTVSWWQMMLKGDQAARGKFVDANCAFCSHPGDYDFGQNGL